MPQEVNLNKVDEHLLFTWLKLYMSDPKIKKKKDIFQLSDKDIRKYIKKINLEVSYENDLLLLKTKWNIITERPFKDFII